MTDISAPWFVAGVGHDIPVQDTVADEVIDALYEEWRRWSWRLAAYAQMPVEARRGKRYFAMCIRGVEVLRLNMRVRRGRVSLAPCDTGFITTLYTALPLRGAIAYIIS